MKIEILLQGMMRMGAGWVLWLLVAASVAALAVIIERTLLLVFSRANLESLEKVLEQSRLKGDLETARRRLEESASVEARVAAAALTTDDHEVASARVAREMVVARAELGRRVGYLGTLGSNAPFVGLLGTVIGIVGAFHELGHDAGRVSSGLMAQIGEALMATAMGLLVAIPAVLAFNLLQDAIQRRMDRAGALAGVALSCLKKVV